MGVVVVEMGGAEGWRGADKKAEVGEEDELSEDEKWVHKRALILQSWSLSGSSRPSWELLPPRHFVMEVSLRLTVGVEHARVLGGNASAVATWRK